MKDKKEETIYDESKELKLFLDGHKPAIIAKNKSSIIHKRLKSSEYMYCRSEWLGMPIFFQSLQIAKNYISILGDDHWKNLILSGTCLGYPTLAVSRFVDMMKSNEPRNDMAYINYCGLYFATFQPYIQDDIRWLDAMYNLPKGYGDVIVQIIDPYMVFKVVDGRMFPWVASGE